jgi:hypothetical protein
MAKKLKVQDYIKYFIPTDEGVLVDTEIFKHRKELRERVWDLISLMTGVGTENDIKMFESVVSDGYILRRQFDAIRNRLFKLVAERDGEFCKNCQSVNDLTLDHIIPLSRGGQNDIANMQILCRSHNSQKGAR